MGHVTKTCMQSCVQQEGPLRSVGFRKEGRGWEDIWACDEEGIKLHLSARKSREALGPHSSENLGCRSIRTVADQVGQGGSCAGWRGTDRDLARPGGAGSNWETLAAFQGLAPSLAHHKRWARCQFMAGEDATKGVWPSLSSKARGEERSGGENPLKPGWEPHHHQEALPDHLCRLRT